MEDREMVKMKLEHEMKLNELKLQEERENGRLNERKLRNREQEVEVNGVRREATKRRKPINSKNKN